MNMIYKRMYMVTSMVCGLFLRFQAGSGTFQHTHTLKPVRISVSSQKFLKLVVPDLTLILSKIGSGSGNQDVKDILQLCIEMSNLLQQQEFLTSEDISKIQKIIGLKKQYLTSKAEPVSIDTVAFKQVLKKIKDAFDVTNLRGFEPDARYIKKFIATPFELQQRRQVRDMIANISDIITHFDGVLITDYDVVVLLHTALSAFLEAQTR